MSEEIIASPRPMAYMHCHSTFSILDGFSQPEDIAKTAKAMGYSAVALTDHGSVGGLYRFNKACKEHKIKPILGVEAYYVNDMLKKDKDEKHYHLTLWAKNKIGYRNIIRLSSSSFINGFYGDPRIDFDILKRNSEGVMVGSACAVGILCGPMLHYQDISLSEKNLKMFQEAFKDDFYVEIMSHSFFPEKNEFENSARQIFREVYGLAKKHGVKTIITGDAHYCRKEEAKAHDIVLSISTGDVVKNSKRFSFGSEDFYIHPAAEYCEKLSKLPHLIDNTMDLANKVEPDLIEPIKDTLPAIPIPEGFDGEEAYLKKLISDGMIERGFAGKPEYEARIKEEMEVITKCGFTRYFLILWDFVRYARNNKIRVGAGRGSGVASLCLYCLKVTGLDPIKYDLMFARFLSKDRISPPDVDIDFDSSKRQLMFDYLLSRYGADCFAHIGTYGSIAAKDAIRTVGKAMDIGGDYDASVPHKGGWKSGPKTLEIVDRIAKSIPNVPDVTIEDAIEISRDLGKRNKLYDKENFSEFADSPKYKDLFKYAKQAEGILKSISIHASGVLITNRPLIDLTPLRTAASAEKDDSKQRFVATQYDMSDIESSGLLKFDILAITMLSIFEDCIEMAEKATGNKIIIDGLEPNDPKVFKNLDNGDTRGVFQLEGEGMTRLLTAIGVDSFEDMIVCNAMYRPGTLRAKIKPDENSNEELPLTELYCAYKHKDRTIKYLHPIMEKVLGRTYGFMIYQEDVMKMSMEMAGFSSSEADDLRKAMGKKKPEIMAKMKDKFLSGCQKNGHDKAISDKIFELMAFFSGYGFNRSHAAAYSYLSYQCAWLKCYYRKYYMCALMSSLASKKKHDKRVLAEKDAITNGIKILPIHINYSGTKYTPEPDGIRRPLTAVDGVGPSNVAGIVAAQPFKNPQDFFLRAKCNASTFELLVNAGCMECWGEKKADLIANFDKYIEQAKKVKKHSEKIAEFSDGDLFNGL